MRSTLQDCLQGTSSISIRQEFFYNFKTSFTFNNHKKQSSYFIILFCLLSGLFLSNLSSAQTVFDPRVNCVNGCTAKDIKKITAALVFPTSPYNQLPSNFSCNTGDNVSVKLAVYLTTQTQKAGIYVYANIRNSATNAIITTLSECFTSGALTSVNGDTKVVFNQSLTWSCGTSIKLTDVYVAWGTGNDDFCQGSADPRCPATTSKCYSLPEGEYIPIVIPSGSGASQTKCSTSPGGSTATFNLTESDATVRGSQPATYLVKWYSDAAGTTELTGTGKTAFVNSTNPQTVYAKVCSNVSPFPCSALQPVVLTVNSTPATPALSKVDNCDGTTTVTAKDGSTTIPSGQLTWSDGGTGNPRSVTSTTALTVIWTVNNCASASSNSVTPAPKTTPNAPALSKVDNCDGTTTVTAKDGSTTIPSGQLTWSDGGTGNPRSVTSTTALTVIWTVNDCASASSNSVTPAPKTTPAAPVLSKVDNCDGTTTITAKDGSNSIIASNELTWSNSASGNPIIVNNTTAVTATRTVAAGCPSLASNSITPAPGTAPSAPTTTTSMNPCTDNTYSVSVQNLGNGTYKLTQQGETQKTFIVPTNGTTINFTGLIPGKGYNVTFENTSGCVSGASSCPVVNAAARMRTDTYQTIEQQIVIEEPTKVTAYPNPFSNKVKFVVTSAIAGKGSLEVYNMLGQKIKSVYQGNIIAGNQIFELSLPSTQRSNLIYVLRVGDKRVTGKLLHLNQ
jgi:hypothetical protein